MIMCFALVGSTAVMAQDTKKCTSTEKKACTADKKAACPVEKKACTAEQKAAKKSCCTSTKK
ncbi:MAG: hypothetical protein RL662_1761 [Bacteroidota bacterium]